jgi:hypothetical protein
MYTKENYLSDLERVKQEIKNLEEAKEGLKVQYINDNKPCNLKDVVKIKLNSGRIAKGEVVSFGILKDSTVCITCYKESGKNKYITVPHLEVEVVSTSNEG